MNERRKFVHFSFDLGKVSMTNSTCSIRLNINIIPEVPVFPLPAPRPRIDVVSHWPLLSSLRPWLSDNCASGGDDGNGGTLDTTCNDMSSSDANARSCVQDVAEKKWLRHSALLHSMGLVHKTSLLLKVARTDSRHGGITSTVFALALTSHSQRPPSTLSGRPLSKSKLYFFDCSARFFCSSRFTNRRFSS